LALGDDVQAKVLKYYIAFRRIKNFASLEIHPAKGCLTVFVKLDPRETALEAGFTRDVSKVGHYGTGDFEITIRSREDLEKAKSLFIKSYEKN
jgi:predicted transport protein